MTVIFFFFVGVLTAKTVDKKNKEGEKHLHRKKKQVVNKKNNTTSVPETYGYLKIEVGDMTPGLCLPFCVPTMLVFGAWEKAEVFIDGKVVKTAGRIRYGWQLINHQTRVQSGEHKIKIKMTSYVFFVFPTYDIKTRNVSIGAGETVVITYDSLMNSMRKKTRKKNIESKEYK
ncbi:MAG: hypothetical protein GXO84_07620 [Chlorobi bacterium]|nr:hypothetical protein [Chlorobiota bacterium]